MAEIALITVTEVKQYREISHRWTDNETRFNAFVMEVQRRNLRELLGESLYYAFMNDDRTSGIYAELLNGKEYTYDGDTISFYGVKPFIIYHWLAIEVNAGDLFHSAYGNISFNNNPQQNFVPAKNAKEEVRRYQENAVMYANDIRQFLNEFSSTYPLWEGDYHRPQTEFEFDII